jgi:hypothetical protein
MANLAHSEKTAKSFMQLIRASKPNKRCAFALGKMGGKEAVVYVARGKPANAAKKLKTTKFEPGKEPKGLSSDSVIVSAAGLLVLDGTMLTLQCRGNPPEALIKEGLRHYFTKLHVTPPWQDVSTHTLADDDEGDEEEESTGSGQDESPVVMADGEPDRDGKTDPVPGYDSERSASPGAARLAQLMLHLGRAPEMHDDATRGVLEQRFEELLKTIPIERLMLALCSRSGVEQVMEQADAIVKQPVERNEKGYADMADALVAMGVDMAKQRHIVVDGEVPKSDTIAAMVKALWAKTPDAPAAGVVQSISALLTRTFADSDPARVRGMLGLPGKLPPAQQPDASPGADGEAASANASDGGYQADALAVGSGLEQGVWTEARADAIAGLRELSQAIAASGDSEAGEALHEIETIIASLPATLDGPASADSAAHFLEESPTAAEVEGENGFGVALSIREPLLRALAPLRSAD